VKRKSTIVLFPQDFDIEIFPPPPKIVNRVRIPIVANTIKVQTENVVEPDTIVEMEDHVDEATKRKPKREFTSESSWKDIALNLQKIKQEKDQMELTKTI
jgi:hypothetical protein